MVGLIAKIGGFFAVLIFGTLILLNVTNVWNPGTVSLTAPDREPCERYAVQHFKGRKIQLTQVRWVFTAQDYGWGCYFEFGNFEVRTVTPMPG